MPGVFEPYRNNVYSQNGEDGILKEISRRLGWKPAAMSVVEFGAWDGKHFSNTFHFVENGAQALYVEKDAEKFKDLLRTVSEYPRIQAINTAISPSKKSPHCLDKVLSKACFPVQFNILSIDIDSEDLDVWASLSCFSPLVVILEVNSLISPGILMRHRDYGMGASFSSALQVGAEKGYTCVAHCGNMIFVANRLLSKLRFPVLLRKKPHLLFDPAWIQEDLTRHANEVDKLNEVLKQKDICIYSNARKIRRLKRTAKILGILATAFACLAIFLLTNKFC